MVMRNLHTLTENEIIHGIIYKDVEVWEHVGLRDKLTDDEIMSLLDHPDFQTFTQHTRDWIYNTVDAILIEDENNTEVIL
jgi:hypothetical protein